MRVEFQPKLGLEGARFKEANEAEPYCTEKLAQCVPFIDDSSMLLDELVRAIRGQQAPITTARDHLRSLSLVPAAIQSIENKSWVNLQEYQKSIGIT